MANTNPNPPSQEILDKAADRLGSASFEIGESRSREIAGGDIPETPEEQEYEAAADEFEDLLNT
jgi:hypothetical protein